MLLRDIHSKLLGQYDWKEDCVPSQSQVRVGTRGGCTSQDGVSKKQETSPLFIPQLKSLHESHLVRDPGENTSNVVVAPIPAQNRTHDYTEDHQSLTPFKSLKETFSV
jgi:hypothetical protein